VDLVDDERVARGDVAVLEPAARDPRRHDHDIPAGSFGGCLALAIDDADTKVGGAKDGFRDRADGECFPGAGAGDYSEALPFAGELEDLASVLALEERVEMQANRELDGLARGARGRDDYDAAGRRLRGREGFAIRREVVIAYVTQFDRLPVPARRVRLVRWTRRLFYARARRRGVLLRVLARALLTLLRWSGSGRRRNWARVALLLLVVLALRLNALRLDALRFDALALLVVMRRRGLLRGEGVRRGLHRCKCTCAAGRRITAEDDARVHGALADGGGAVGRCRLVRRRNAVDPDAAHARRRTMTVGHA
jgi:hypothetical protein